MRQGQTRLVLSGLGIAGLLLVFTAGCESPAMAKARRLREQSLARSIKTVTSLDDRRSENLERTGRVIADRYRRDEQAARENIHILGRLFEEEFETWAQKEPAYRRAIGHQLEGDAASIERTVPHFIY